MGAVFVHVRSAEIRDSIHFFLIEKYRPWSELVGDDEVENHFNGPFIDDELTGMPGCTIGFGFDERTVPGPEWEYHSALVRWMALQVGKRRSKFPEENLTFDRTVPFLLVEGPAVDAPARGVPVLAKDDWPTTPKRLRPYISDALGMAIGDEVAHELAWHYVTKGAVTKVGATMHGKPTHLVHNALVQEGLGGARELLGGIRAQITRLDALWTATANANFAAKR